MKKLLTAVLAISLVFAPMTFSFAEANPSWWVEGQEEEITADENGNPINMVPESGETEEVEDTTDYNRGDLTSYLDMAQEDIGWTLKEEALSSSYKQLTNNDVAKLMGKTSKDLTALCKIRNVMTKYTIDDKVNKKLIIRLETTDSLYKDYSSMVPYYEFGLDYTTKKIEVIHIGYFVVGVGMGSSEDGAGAMVAIVKALSGKTAKMENVNYDKVEDKLFANETNYFTSLPLVSNDKRYYDIIVSGFNDDNGYESVSHNIYISLNQSANQKWINNN